MKLNDEALKDLAKVVVKNASPIIFEKLEEAAEKTVNPVDDVFVSLLKGIAFSLARGDDDEN